MPQLVHTIQILVDRKSPPPKKKLFHVSFPTKKGFIMTNFFTQKAKHSKTRRECLDKHQPKRFFNLPLPHTIGCSRLQTKEFLKIAKRFGKNT